MQNCDGPDMPKYRSETFKTGGRVCKLKPKANFRGAKIACKEVGCQAGGSLYAGGGEGGILIEKGFGVSNCAAACR